MGIYSELRITVYCILIKKDGQDDYLTKSIWIHIKNVGYAGCKSQLSEKNGNLVEESEEPFVKIDGGAVKWRLSVSGCRDKDLFHKSKRLYRNKNRKIY